MSFDLITALGSVAGAGAQIGTGIAAGKEFDRSASLSRSRGQQASADQIRAGKRLAGKQRARFAKAGVEQSGSVLDVLAQTAADAQLNADRARAGFEQDAQDLESRGGTARTAGILGAGKTLLGAGPSFKSLFDDFNSRGSGGNFSPSAVSFNPSDVAAAGRIA